MAAMPRRERWTLLGLWAALGLLPLFLRPLWEPDEARYAEIPREMIAAADWLTPRLNGVLYFEKPPLQYWLSALSLQGFGQHAWAARLPLALASALVMWAAWHLAARVGARKPFWAVFMALTSLLGFVVGQILTLDALFSAFVVAALAAGVESVCARAQGAPHRAWTVTAHALLAGAFLTKGLAALVLAGGTFLLSLAFARTGALRRAVLGLLFDPLGLLVSAGLSAPWFILVNRAHPGHAAFFFIHEHFTRFATHAHARQGSDNWFLDKLYFLPILAAGLLPWLSHTVVGLKRGLGLLRGKAPEGPTAALHRWVVGVAILAAVWPVVFFTLSGSKLPPYILPSIVPLAALATTFEREGESPRALRRIGWELLGLGLVFFLGGFLYRDLDPGPWFQALALAFGLTGAWCISQRGLDAGRFMMAFSASLLLLPFAAQRVAGGGKTVDALVRQAPPEAQWISFGQYFQGISWMTGRRCVVVAGTGELAYGRDHLSPADQLRWMPEHREDLLPAAQRLRAEGASEVWVLADDRDWARLSDIQKEAFEIRGKANIGLVARLR